MINGGRKRGFLSALGIKIGGDFFVTWLVRKCGGIFWISKTKKSTGVKKKECYSKREESKLCKQLQSNESQFGD